MKTLRAQTSELLVVLWLCYIIDIPEKSGWMFFDSLTLLLTERSDLISERLALLFDILYHSICHCGCVPHPFFKFCHIIHVLKFKRTKMHDVQTQHEHNFLYENRKVIIRRLFCENTIFLCAFLVFIKNKLN